MKGKEFINRSCLYFSSWSKKGYSIFIGLGREVHISRLALSMYKNVLLKSVPHGVIVNTDREAENVIRVLLLNVLWKITEILREKYARNIFIVKETERYIAKSDISFFYL